MAATEGGVSLYRFYDSEGALLYVGITEAGAMRWNQHRKSKHWWSDVASTTVEHFATRAEALEVERRAIIAEKPLHNIIHNRRTSREAAKQRGIPVNNWIRWCCDVCGHGISNGDGYVWTDRDSEWDAVHRRCDDRVDVTGYWIGVERLRTKEEIASFRDHLTRRVWFSSIDFDRCTRRASSLVNR